MLCTNRSIVVCFMKSSPVCRSWDMLAVVFMGRENTCSLEWPSLSLRCNLSTMLLKTQTLFRTVMRPSDENLMEELHRWTY